MTTSIKFWIVAGVLALLAALWLVKGIVVAGAARQTAIAHKIEIRRSSPPRIGFLRRRHAAQEAGLTLAETDPGGFEVEIIDQPNVPVEVAEGIEVVLVEQTK